MKSMLDTSYGLRRHGRSIGILKLRRVASAALALGTAILLTVCTIVGPKAGENGSVVSPTAPMSVSMLPETTLSNDERLLTQSGAALEGLAQPSQGGWAYESQIQGGNDQTDRDVGAASVGMGFLALADRYPAGSHQWLTDAQHVATWLIAVSHTDSNGGIWWKDYVDDPNQSNSQISTYTSFDDGSLGIGDFFWRLYEKTNNPQYKTFALGSVTWTLSQADTVGTAYGTGYRWIWDTTTRNNSFNDPNAPPAHYMGMGMGVVGIINTLATYYQRTSNSDPVFAKQCLQYMQGALNYLQSVRDTLGSAQQGGDSSALPETGDLGQTGDTVENSGYLSGAAGAAYMYLNLYQIFGNRQYLTQAEGLLSWLTSSGGPEANVQTGIAWHIATDPQDSGNQDNAQVATGFEEGSAGIGWTFLQAYNVTGNAQYLTVARDAADWLLSPSVVVSDGHGGYSWPEDYNPTSPYIRPNLDNGAAGIGMFLYDLYAVTKDSTYLDAAQEAATWLDNTAIHRTQGAATIALWKDNDEGNIFTGDPSWHWGDAGVADFLARLTGPTNETLDIPGEQPGLIGARH
ncbi:MAG TPA: lanthionine synthetase LanC family protein [Verrucomicrobiae bacterium]|nr:lanthionine synthetase LanC family protein [Verrucomicrobiae bacterium]